MRKTKRNLEFISLIVTLCLLVACVPEPSPPLVLEEVIVGTWATSLADSDIPYEDVMFDGHTFEFKSNGEYLDKINFLENSVSHKGTGTYTINDSVLQWEWETRTGSNLCTAVSQNERFQVLSVEQNKITLEMLSSGCVNNRTTGAEVVFERCEWPPNAETEVFAFCKRIESDQNN